MIGFVSGTVISKNIDSQDCVILVNDVGYEIRLTKGHLEGLALGEKVSLWLAPVVREDAFLLFGFPSEEEKYFFRLLLTASGIGPKAALSLLGEHGPAQLAQFILEKRSHEISSAPGVGRKSAERVVLELGPKIEKQSWIQLLEKRSEKSGKISPSPKTEFREDVQSALVNLGYPQTQVKGVIDRLLEGLEETGLAFESIFKRALQELSRRDGRA